MNNLTFLRAKHWKLFLFIFVLPFVSAITMVIVQIIIFNAAFRSHQEPDVSSVIPVMLIALPLSLAGAFVQLRWFWAVATGLQSYMHPDMRKLHVKRFKFFFFFPLIYILLISTVLPLVINFSKGDPSFGVLAPLILLMVLGHFFAMFCLIYNLYFVAKTIRSAEMQREAHFSDYIGEFFLIWILPIGIWFIQPRINAIVDPYNPPKTNGPVTQDAAIDLLDH